MLKIDRVTYNIMCAFSMLDKPSIRKASQISNVPLTTLRRRLAQYNMWLRGVYDILQFGLHPVILFSTTGNIPDIPFASHFKTRSLRGEISVYATILPRHIAIDLAEKYDAIVGAYMVYYTPYSQNTIKMPDENNIYLFPLFVLHTTAPKPQINRTQPNPPDIYDLFLLTHKIYRPFITITEILTQLKRYAPHNYERYLAPSRNPLGLLSAHWRRHVRDTFRGVAAVPIIYDKCILADEIEIQNIHPTIFVFRGGMHADLAVSLAGMPRFFYAIVGEEASLAVGYGLTESYREKIYRLINEAGIEDAMELLVDPKRVKQGVPALYTYVEKDKDEWRWLETRKLLAQTKK